MILLLRHERHSSWTWRWLEHTGGLKLQKFEGSGKSLNSDVESDFDFLWISDTSVPCLVHSRRLELSFTAWFLWQKRLMSSMASQIRKRASQGGNLPKPKNKQNLHMLSLCVVCHTCLKQTNATFSQTTLEVISPKAAVPGVLHHWTLRSRRARLAPTEKTGQFWWFRWPPWPRPRPSSWMRRWISSKDTRKWKQTTTCCRKPQTYDRMARMFRPQNSFS